MDAVEERVNHRNNFNENFFPIKITIDNHNFIAINNLHLLMEYHFKNFEIPYITLNNYKNEICSDFRYGSRFKKIFQKNLQNYGNLENFFFSIFLDDTNINKKKVKVVYLTFTNDILVTNQKKIIYCISAIDNCKYKKIKIKFQRFIVQKLQNELINIKNNIKGNLICIIADNLESNEILNFKNSFSKNYVCRICDHTLKNLNENSLNEYIMKSNNFYISQIQLNHRDSKNSLINRIIDISEFFFVEDFDYIDTMVTELQHCEMEGEIYRDIILLLSKFPELIKNEKMKQILIHLKEKFGVECKKIEEFFEEVEELKEKVYKKKKEENENIEIEENNDKNMEIEEQNENIEIEKNNEQNENIDIQEQDEIIQNENIDIQENIEQENQINKPTKKNQEIKKLNYKKKKLLSSSEIFYLFSTLLVFFYDFFLEKKNEDVIKIFVCHYKYLKILLQTKFFEEDLKNLKELVLERILLLIKNDLKIVPKTLLTIHYDYYIRTLGPIKFFSSFIYENYNHIIKTDVIRNSKNTAITALKKNYSFFLFEKNIRIPKINDLTGEINYLKISNHLIKKYDNALYLGN
jgi:hypothetical protein